MSERPERGARVLLAEDTPVVAQLVSGLLTACGHEVVAVAQDGAAAVSLCCELKPDVVLMDIEMPELDGIDATRMLMERCPTPVVILSAHEGAQVTERASAAGAGAYLLKPPTLGDLQRGIAIARARFDDLLELRRINAALEVQQRELEQRNAELASALHRVEQLQGLLPICASCKKVRDDEGYWQQVETYVARHSKLQFSHGLCPPCFRQLYPQLAQEIPEGEEPGPF